MTEHDALAERQQAVRLDGGSGRIRDTEPLSRPPQERQVARWVGGRHQQQAAGITRHPRQPPREALLDPCGQGHRRRQTEATGELRRRQPARQLQQGEGVATRLDNDPLQHALVRADPATLTATASAHHHAPEARREALAEPVSASGNSRAATTNAIFSASRRRADERKGARRGTIEPLRVVDDTEQRPLLGGLGQQAEDRQSDEEGARGLPGGQAEGHRKRLALRIRQTARGAQGSASTAAEEQRTRAPSRLRHRRRGRPKSPAPPRRRTPATPSCRRPGPRTSPGPRRAPRALPRAAVPARRARAGGRQAE